MKWIKRMAGLLFVLLLCTGMAGCSLGKDADTPEKSTEKLKASNEIPDNGVITEEQMAAIARKDGEFTFSGEEKDFSYVWIYNGKMIKNPQEQRLKVTEDNEKTEKVKEAANHASVGMGIKLETMNMAAPASLEITLKEKWDADTVVCCKYQKDKVYKMADVAVSVSGSDDQAVTKLTFQVTETGDTYYLVGGNAKSPEEDKKDTKQKAPSGENTDADTKQDSKNSQNNKNQESQTGEILSNSNEAQTQENGETPDNAEQEENETGQTAAHTCQISIECSTILNNWGDLNESKAEFVPSDGWILYPSEVEFTPGETVFDVLKRVCADTGIHMSSRYTPMYGSYYIEGINQLYEFDCGQNSGWMYRVNGWYPNYGCSSYEVSDGDNIEWRYTCDLGVDVGGGVY